MLGDPAIVVLELHGEEAQELLWRGSTVVQAACTSSIVYNNTICIFIIIHYVGHVFIPRAT